MMKKCLFLLFVCQFMARAVFSQFEWVGDIGFSASPTKLIKTKPSDYVICGIAKEIEYRHWPFIGVLDSSGSFIKSELFHLADIEHLIELPDSSFLAFGVWGCDVLSYGFWKLDRNYNLDPTFNKPEGEWYNAVVLSNGDIIYSGYWDVLKKVDKFGNDIWEKSGTFGPGNDYALLSGDSILVYNEYSSTVLYDSSGNLLSIYPYKFDKIKVTPQGNILCSSDDSLYLLSSNLELINALALTQGVYIEDFDANGDKVAILTTSNSAFIYSEDLDSLSMFEFDARFSAQQIILENDRLVVSGQTFYGSQPWANVVAQPVIKKIPLNGPTLSETKDIGAFSISNPSGIVFTEMPYEFYKLTYEDIYVSVKNFGNTVVNDMNLNLDFGDFALSWEDCWIEYQNYKRHFSNLNLAPGDTKELYFGDITVWHKNTTGYSPSENICIWTSSPDKKIETDRTNDKACIQVLTDTKEGGLTVPTIKIWPNPAQDFVQLQMEGVHGTAQFQILDVQGRVLKSILVENGQSDAELSVSDIPNGMYLWRLVKQEGKIYSGKIAILR
ncbi:MAG: T9SS type A sorting domain-containing protein [Bacteroidetes bacterium]|nr:T9SS type A sorting domain-containing protein [Bacteroidota bacterium]